MRIPKDEKNSLLHKCPKACLDFDFEKNSPYKPSDFFPKSEFILHWKCHLNPEHCWIRPIKEQTRSVDKGMSCPYCSHTRPSKEYNLKALYPDLMDEWCYEKNVDIDPSQILPMSDKVVFWCCPKYPEHIYPMPIKKRTDRGDKCPFCRNRRQDPKKSLAALYP